MFNYQTFTHHNDNEFIHYVWTAEGDNVYVIHLN